MKWRILIGPLVLLLLWAALAAAGWVRPLFLPSPARVGEALVSLLVGGPLWADVGATLYRTCTSFAIATVVGLAVGVPLGASSRIYESVEVVFDFFRSMPSPALVPLAMLLFGLGDLSRIAVAAFSCSLVNAIQVAYAIRHIPRYRVLSAQLAGASRLFLLTRVLIPSVMPGLIAGWRITLSLALIIIVVTEMFIGTRVGLGMRIYDYHLMFRSAEMYATILVVGIVGYLLNKTVEITERHVTHWAGK